MAGNLSKFFFASRDRGAISRFMNRSAGESYQRAKSKLSSSISNAIHTRANGQQSKAIKLFKAQVRRNRASQNGLKARGFRISKLPRGTANQGFKRVVVSAKARTRYRFARGRLALVRVDGAKVARSRKALGRHKSANNRLRHLLRAKPAVRAKVKLSKRISGVRARAALKASKGKAHSIKSARAALAKQAAKQAYKSKVAVSKATIAGVRTTPKIARLAKAGGAVSGRRTLPKIQALGRSTLLVAARPGTVKQTKKSSSKVAGGAIDRFNGLSNKKGTIGPTKQAANGTGRSDH